MQNNFIHNKTLALLVKTKGIISQKIWGGLGHVFMLHRVLPLEQKNEFNWNKSLAITPEGLEKWILYFKQNNYEFWSVEQLFICLQNKIRPKKKFVVLTIDDGYKDNLIYGLPVIEKHQVPLSIFVTSCFPNQTANYWWYLMENHMLNSKQIEVLDGTVFIWENAVEAQINSKKVREIVKSYSHQQFNDWVKTKVLNGENLNTNWQKSLSLTWDDIRTLNNHPLVSIGGHTLNHLSLKAQDIEIAQKEISENKEEIEQHIKQKIYHFVYPYGSLNDAGKREYEILQKVGYKTGFLNHPGNVFYPKNSLDFYKIPRMGLSDETPMERIENIRNGIFHFSTNGFKKIVD
jgi:peptidoglycan/xylan/chitin deacetylase (PgdA/CDA1 family)